ncbi:MAG: hypothetical protein HQL58_13770 [Magnetococcales bacterium]|nr:hypothetical protein [Magnetococcales bacterium]
MQLSEERSEPCLTAPGLASHSYYNMENECGGSLHQRPDPILKASGPLKQLSLETVLTQSDLQRLLRILTAESP